MAFSVANALVSPGVFTETFINLAAADVLGLARVPFVVGPGNEELELYDIQLHRGSSSIADNLVYKEDLSDQIDAVNGVRIFYVDNFPIVRGDGTGSTTDDPNDVIVYLNNNRIQPIQLDGSLGKITLSTIPRDGDTLEVTYSYRRRDTLISDQDLSVQVDGSNTELKVQVLPIVEGDDGGIATTDTTKVTVTVDGTEVTVESVDGNTGLITLATAPAAGTIVLVTYYTNKWQNSFDEVEFEIARTIRVGTIPERDDFIQGNDFVVSGNRIYWGTFAIVEAGTTAAGTEPFDEDYLVVNTVDDHIFYEESSDWPDGSGLAFHVSQVPSDGTGRDIPADRLGTTSPSVARTDMVKAYEGPDPITAQSNPILVEKIDANNRLITLDTAPSAWTPASGSITFALLAAWLNGDGFAINGVTFGVARRATVDFEIIAVGAIDGKTVTIDDGLAAPVTFEFDTDGDVTPGNYPVAKATPGAFANPLEAATYLAAAIATAANIYSLLSVNVVQGGTTITVTNVEGGLVDIFTTNDTLNVNIDNIVEDQGFTPATNYSYSEGNDSAETAANAVEAINASTGTNVSALANVGTPNQIDLTATIQSGNSITLTETTTGIRITVSGATLAGAVDNYVYITYYQSRILDDIYTLEVTRQGKDITQEPGPGSVGQYTVINQLGSAIREVIEDPSTHSVADPNFPGTIAWPAGVPVTHTDPENGVDEVLTLTFDSATHFVLTSDNPVGSGGDGYIGVTYIDAVTGLTFTLGDPQNPSDTAVLYNYAAADVVTLAARSTHDVSLEPRFSIPGIRHRVDSTEDIVVGNQATLSSYDKSGNEPDVGDFYYISYAYSKPDEAFLPQIFTALQDGRDALGDPDVSNPIAFAFDVCYRNNGRVCGVLQVRKETGSEVPSTTGYINALQLLEAPLPGGIRVETIVPLTADQTVWNELKAHCERLSGPTYAAERRFLVGAEIGTTPTQAQDYAASLRSRRGQLIYSGGGGMIVNQLDALGRELEFPVDAIYLAAAYAGLDTNEAYDVAEPLTKKALVGFVRALARLNENESNILANAGVTVIDDLEPVQEIRWAVTTDVRNVLTREAPVTKITDYVQIRQRELLKRFIGVKNLTERQTEIIESVTNLFNILVDNDIIVSFSGTRVYADPATPTGLIVESTYSPVLPLNFITVRNFVSVG